MDPLPVLPLERDGTLLPLALALRWLSALPDGTHEIAMADLPPLNGHIPGLMRAGGIPALSLLQSLPVACFTWEGLGGGRILVNGPEASPGDAPLHQGSLPPAVPTGHEAGDLASLVELARLEDAQAVHGLGAGASWDSLLAIANARGTPRVPPLLTRGQLSSDGYGVWNPLPFSRRGTVAVAAPETRAPWSLIHAATGSTHPVQVIEGPLGRELLIEAELPALGAVRLQPRKEPAEGAAWEVSTEVLDNGIVRAELDVHGQVERLCFAGRFVEVTGPLVRPLLDGVPASSRPAEIRILEDGPVRARIGITRETPGGVLHTTYTLHAHEALLHVSVSWDGAATAGLVIDHPTSLRYHDARLAGELGSETRAQGTSILAPPAPAVRGCRWAMLGDGRGGGLAILAQRPFACEASAGHLRLPCSSSVAYALADPAGVDVPRAALGLAVPLRPYTGNSDLASPLRLADGAGVVPMWIRQTADGCELTLVEALARRSRLWIFPKAKPTEAWRSDARGKRLGKLPITPEGDGVQVDLHPGELALVRWR